RSATPPARTPHPRKGPRAVAASSTRTARSRSGTSASTPGPGRPRSSRRCSAGLRAALVLAEPADEVRQLRVAEHLAHGLRLAEVEPVVVGGAMKLGARRLP